MFTLIGYNSRALPFPKIKQSLRVYSVMTETALYLRRLYDLELAFGCPEDVLAVKKKKKIAYYIVT